MDKLELAVASLLACLKLILASGLLLFYGLLSYGVWLLGNWCQCPNYHHSFTDRSGIENLPSVEHLQENLIRMLRRLVNKTTGGEPPVMDSPRFTKLLLRLPDLRTLNNMHSEKLLSFRIDP